MGRIRSIKPEFPQNQKIGRLSREARLLFIQLWTIVDDEGRARAASRLLASLLYPYDDDAEGLIEGWLEELETKNQIRRYQVGGSDYLVINNWLKHQKIDHPSKSRLPKPHEPSREIAKPHRSLAPDLNPGPRILDLGSSPQAGSLAQPREASPKKARASPPKPAAEQKDQINGEEVKGVKRAHIPRQGAVSADKKFIYFRKGTMEFEAYSQDYQEALGEAPDATEHGRWFKIAGEKVA
jgi:hypothetical protein